ncbi:HAD family hydrolase [Citricoccus sp. K5]|uniref:HAD family hydrolase n=1 Tax=Citricoccus sp. K5 TaxID=2653135 RepID=UPI0012F1289E|nr:HAD-IA family hydrolase [Citricoccus sp. K5]VXB65353.1 Phosphoglycolate phosphatase [Citricoccus sp. K5]
MTNYTSVVFDLDGTLVDSSEDITAALNEAIRPVGGRELRAAEVVGLLGEGSLRLVEGALAQSTAGMPGAVGELKQVHARYAAEYRARPAELSTVYPGVREALAALDQAGIAMGVCTNKSQVMAEIVLEELGITRYFRGIVGNDAVPSSKPDPAHVIACFEALGESPATGLYVGDSVIDEAAATGADVDFLAVGWAPVEVKGLRLDSYFDLPGLVLEPSRI